MKFLMVLILIAGSIIPLAAGEPRLAMFNFTDINGHESIEGDDLSLIFLPELSSRSGIVMIERADLDKLMKEKKLALTGLSTAQYAMIAGILKADYLITGRIYTLDGQKIINLKLIDCATGGVSGNSFILNDGPGNLDTAAKQLADYITVKMKNAAGKASSPHL